MTGRVSALVVTYEHGAYVRDAILSILSQTRPVDEVVVVDDGSPDETIAQVRAVADERVRIIALPHRGLEHVAETYNTGIAACTGDIIAFCEGDDRWPADRLARQVPAFDDSAVVLSHGRYAVIGARGTLLHSGVGPQIHIPRGAYDPLPYILRASYIMLVTVAARTDALRASGGFGQLGESHGDYPTYLALAQRGLFHYQPVALGEWRRHGASAVYRLAGTPSAAAECAKLALEVRAKTGRTDLPSRQAIERTWMEHQARHAWGAARVLLVGGRHAEARHIVLRGLRLRSSLTMKLRLLLALAAAVLHLDLEAIARLRTGRSVFSEVDR